MSRPSSTDIVDAMIQAGLAAADLYEIGRDDIITKGHLRKFMTAALRAQAAGSSALAQPSSPSGPPVGWGGHLPGKIEP